jgi:hypothetical protein
MNRMLLGAVTVALLVLTAGESRAEWSSWNPFASSTTKSSSQRISGSSATSWWPSWGKSTASRGGPTTWQRVQAAPSTMYNKTKETLSPLNPFKQEQKPVTPAGYLGSSNKRKTPAKSASWFPFWSSEEEEAKGPPLTVSDWLDAPRPQ